MNLVEALRLLKENNLICEFIDKSISKDMMLRVLSKLKGENVKPWIKRNSGSRKILITLKREFLEGTGLNTIEFKNGLFKYGWNLVGNTRSSLILAPNKSDPEFGEMKDPSETYKRVLYATKNWYIRGTNIPPRLVKQYGFRCTNDRNLEKDVRSNERLFNEPRVYLFSVWNLIRSLGENTDVKEILYKLYSLSKRVENYGVHSYLIKLPSGIKFNIDPEYDNDRSYKNVAGWITQPVLPSWVKVEYDVYDDPIETMLDAFGLSDLRYTEAKRENDDVTSDEYDKNKNLTDDKFSDDDIDLGTYFLSSAIEKLKDYNSPGYDELKELLKKYDRHRMVIWNTAKKDEDDDQPESSSVVTITPGRIRGKEAAADNYPKVGLVVNRPIANVRVFPLRVTKDGKSCEISSFGSYGDGARNSDLVLSKELKRFLSDPEVVEAVRKSNEQLKKFDDRYNLKDRYISKQNWARW